MSLSPTAKWLAGLIFLAAIPIQQSYALIMVNGFYIAKNVRTLSGSYILTDLPARVGWWEGPPFGGGHFHVEYQTTDTCQLNEALAAFIKIKSPKLKIVLHNGVKYSLFLDDPHFKDSKTTPPKAQIDFAFSIWDPERLRQHREFLQEIRSTHAIANEVPTLDIYFSPGRLSKDKITLPTQENLTIGWAQTKSK